MARILPDPEDYDRFAPAPGSPVWQAFNDSRMLFTAGYALLLQVAHPTVGQGVHDYSSFRSDPWGRLFRTLDYVHGTIYGGPEMAGRIGRRVREMHRTIRGRRADGAAYTAMEPDAFAWVHATLALGIVEGRRQFARPMTPGEAQAFWSQWLDVGRLIGVRERDLPAAWADAETYVEEMMRDRLVWTPAVPEVLETIGDVMPPRVPGVPAPLVRALGRAGGYPIRAATGGLLPPDLRVRLGVTHTRADAAAYAALRVAARASGPFRVGPLREFGPAYVRMRRTALERGDVASAPPAAPRPAAAAAS